MGTYKNTRKKFDAEATPLTQQEPAAVYGAVTGIPSLQGMLGAKRPIEDTLSLIQFTRNGIRKDHLVALAAELGFNLTQLSQLLHMSLRTFQRIPNHSKLDVFSSEQAVELAMILEQARKVFSNRPAIQQWFQTPLVALNGNTPYSIMDTSFGTRWVMQLLGRIEHGVFS